MTRRRNKPAREVVGISPKTVAAPTRDSYVRKIRAAWNKTVAGVFDMGRLLIEAKAHLPHGEFESIFSGIGERLPFGQRTAEILMAIARNEVLANPNHGSILPASWRTLGVLAAMQPARLKEAIDDGEVFPEMTRADAEALTDRGLLRVLAAFRVLHEAKRQYGVSDLMRIDAERRGDSRVLLGLPEWLSELYDSWAKAEDEGELQPKYSDDFDWDDTEDDEKPKAKSKRRRAA